MVPDRDGGAAGGRRTDPRLLEDDDSMEEEGAPLPAARPRPRPNPLPGPLTEPTAAMGDNPSSGKGLALLPLPPGAETVLAEEADAVEGAVVWKAAGAEAADRVCTRRPTPLSDDRREGRVG